MFFSLWETVVRRGYHAVFTASWFSYEMLDPNLMLVEQLKHLIKQEKHNIKKRCQNLQSLGKKKNNKSDKSYTPGAFTDEVNLDLI